MFIKENLVDIKDMVKVIISLNEAKKGLEIDNNLIVCNGTGITERYF